MTEEEKTDTPMNMFLDDIDLQLEHESITLNEALKRVARKLCEQERECAELRRQLENLAQCELCDKDLLATFADGTGHCCVCIECYNKQHTRAEQAERALEAARKEIDELRSHHAK